MSVRSKLTGNRFVRISQGSAEQRGKVISLFTGAGGMEIGLESAGFETAICVEIDPDSRETLRKNREHWVLFEDEQNRTPGDLRAIRPEELLLKANLKRGEAALVTGGAPCQPFSNMGKKLGKSDPKNGDLFLDFVKIVLGTQPAGFIFENVAGIAQGRHNEVVEYMTAQFAGSGYSVAFEVLNAADYGVPQQRKRFIMLGRKGDAPAFPLPTHTKDGLFPDVFSPEPIATLSQWKTVAEAFEEIPRGNLQRADCVGMRHASYMVERMAMIPQGRNFKVLPMQMRPKCWQSGKHEGHDTFGRMEGGKPAPTIRTAGYNPTKGKYIHPFENRGINTAEMAALQSFPADWEFRTVSGKPSIVSIGRQIGNAVPPAFAYALGSAIFA
ncbi:MAG: DNA cytosine methyltransferase [Erythrobacter sp.]